MTDSIAPLGQSDYWTPWMGMRPFTHIETLIDPDFAAELLKGAKLPLGTLVVPEWMEFRFDNGTQARLGYRSPRPEDGGVM